MSHIEANLRAQARLDYKWIKTDLQTTFQSPEALQTAWNSLITDGELTGHFCDGLLNCAGVLARKGHNGKYYCGLRVRHHEFCVF